MDQCLCGAGARLLAGGEFPLPSGCLYQRWSWPREVCGVLRAPSPCSLGADGPVSPTAILLSCSSATGAGTFCRTHQPMGMTQADLPSWKVSTQQVHRKPLEGRRQQPGSRAAQWAPGDPTPCRRGRLSTLTAGEGTAVSVSMGVSEFVGQ